jgi:glutamate dehydrogenase
MNEVKSYIEKKELIPPHLVNSEVEAFYDKLGIDDMYFEQESVSGIGDHIIALYGAKVQAYIRNENAPEINLKRQTESGAIYIHTSHPGVPHPKNYESLIDSRFLDLPSSETPFRIESYLSTGRVATSDETPLRCYLIRQCDFVNPTPNKVEERSIQLVADKNFLHRVTAPNVAMFERVMHQVLDSNGPVMEVIDIEDGAKRLVVGFKRRSTKSFFSAISDVFHYYGLTTSRKYIDQFSNGVTICSFDLTNTPRNHGQNISDVIDLIVEEASLIYCLPSNPLRSFVQSNTLSVTQSVYGNIGWIFAQHFLKRLGSEYSSLSSIIDTKNITHVEALTNIKKRLRADTFTREYILEIIQMYPELIQLLYQHFATIHHVSNYNQPKVTEEQVLESIRKTVQNQNEYKIFESYLTFNKNVLKTNFYKASKVALSFRLNPKFMSEVEYPRPVFGMFLVVGAGFRGFHLRFRDIARGG